LRRGASQDKIKQERDNALAAFEKEKEKIRMMGRTIIAFVEAELRRKRRSLRTRCEASIYYILVRV